MAPVAATETSLGRTWPGNGGPGGARGAGAAAGNGATVAPAPMRATARAVTTAPGGNGAGGAERADRSGRRPPGAGGAALRPAPPGAGAPTASGTRVAERTRDPWSDSPTAPGGWNDESAVGRTPTS